MIKEWQKMFPDSFLQTFSDDKVNGKTICKPLKDTTQEECEQLNKEGAGIFFSPNGFSSFKKRSEQNCDKINWWFVDIEGYPKTLQQQKIKEFLHPSMIIETKNGYHVYWKIKGESIYWHNVILKLIDFFSSDFAISSLNEVLRIPTFLHQKDKEPFEIKLIIKNDLEYTEHQMIKALPEDKQHEYKYKHYEESDDILDEIKQIPIKSVLDKLGVRYNSKNAILEGKEVTSAQIEDKGNYIHRFSGKPGSGTTIDCVLTWGRAKNVKEAIDWLAEEYHIKKKALERKADKPILKQIFKSVADFSLEETCVADEDILSYGFKELDEATGGIFPTTLAVIGARSGHGKSDFCRYIAKEATKKGKKVYYFDLENEPGDFIRRELKTDLSHYGHNIKKTDLKRKTFWESDKAELAKDLLKNIGDTYGQDMMVYSKTDIPTFNDFLKYMDAVEDADLIVIDHLHYFSMNDEEQQHKQISDIMQRSQSFTRTKKIPIILASHVRNPLGKERPPVPSDLFGSSNIEKQCEVLIMPYKIPLGEHTEEYNTKIFIAKNRPESKYYEFLGKFDYSAGRITNIFTQPGFNKDPF